MASGTSPEWAACGCVNSGGVNTPPASPPPPHPPLLAAYPVLGAFLPCAGCWGGGKSSRARRVQVAKLYLL